MQIIYLELPKFRRYLGKSYPKTGLERWLLYFSNEEGERMNKAAAENTALAAAKEIESAFWSDETEKELYFAHQQLLMDAYSDEHTFEYLLEQEREKTEKAEKMAAVAEQEGRAKVASNLLKKGLDVNMIIEVSGLSREDIEKLR
ncbi:MAG: Rpn family recombination-promoting nuclease/putative transposase [Synergistaceae bacterium]|jgi:predicted transposase/invertase (TIGR01784 family)|nr:Rpn family recombination-promoting nuclease/putative transposase [Synergistaceae bacterium]